mmetsp:Transcript_14123/g.32955  ORF Transcript_14123/g.32955 Transcript_14123/m.32955 type:complete len:397 (+) Transcript_14123:462-1652(+)
MAFALGGLPAKLSMPHLKHCSQSDCTELDVSAMIVMGCLIPCWASMSRTTVVAWKPLSLGMWQSINTISGGSGHSTLLTRCSPSHAMVTSHSKLVKIRAITLELSAWSSDIRTFSPAHESTSYSAGKSTSLTSAASIHAEGTGTPRSCSIIASVWNSISAENGALSFAAFWLRGVKVVTTSLRLECTTTGSAMEWMAVRSSGLDLALGIRAHSVLSPVASAATLRAVTGSTTGKVSAWQPTCSRYDVMVSAHGTLGTSTGSRNVGMSWYFTSQLCSATSSSATSGNSIVNALPHPTTLSTLSEPPISSTSWCAIHSPSPDPPESDRAESVAFRRNICSMSSSGIPSLVSVTQITTPASSGSASTVVRTLPWWVFLLALLSTLRMIWRTRVWSPTTL